MTNRQKRSIAFGCAALVAWEVLSSLAFAYALPSIAEWGRPYGVMLWFGRFTVPPNPFLGILQYLTPLLHGRGLSPVTWLSIRLACSIGAVGIVIIYLLWLRIAWARRLRRRVSVLGDKGTPRAIERADDDNFGHARLMDNQTALATFPARSGKLVGTLDDGTLLFDECWNSSAVSFEFIGTRGGKTSRLIALITFWAIPELIPDNPDPQPEPVVVFDPAQEIGHMVWRVFTGMLRRVYIMNPDVAPKDEDGLLRPWAHLIAQTNIIGWIDTTHPLAAMHVHSVTQLFFEEDDVRTTANGEFFTGTAESLMACLLAHVLWDHGIWTEDGVRIPPFPRDLKSVGDLLALPADDLRAFLLYVRKYSPSSLARRYAGPLAACYIETFSDIHQTCVLATRWLAIDALADMVCGDTFAVTDICYDRSMALFVQLPMGVCMAFKNISRVVFGTLAQCKIDHIGTTYPLVVTDESWLLKARAIRQIILAGGKYRIALHQAWQSRGDMDRVWGLETRESFFDNAAWIALGPLGDLRAARDVSEACGHYGAMAYSSGDNSGVQYGSLFGRWSRGRNLNRHPIKRFVFYCHEVMQDLDRNVRLILRLKQPLVVGAAPYFQIRELDGLIDPSPYARIREDIRRPWYRLYLRKRELPAPIELKEAA